MVGAPRSAHGTRAYSASLTRVSGNPGGFKVMGLRDHVICDSDLHVMEPPDLWERYIDPAYAHAAPAGPRRDPARHAGAGQEPRDAAHGRHVPDARRGPQDGLAEAPRQRLRRVRGAGLGRASRRSTPWTPRASTWPCSSRPAGCSSSASTRPSRSARDGLEPEFATAIARAYNDWLQGLLRPRPGPHVRRRHGGAARRPRRGRRGAALRRGARLQVDLPPRPPRSTAGPGTTRPTTRCGPRSSGSACRWPSTAAARPT